jgi:dTDP-4-dehydrorhamnose 3,5-epimerase
MKTKENKKYTTKGDNGDINGYLIPIYNINDGFFEKGMEPKQVYVTSVLPGFVKGPHLHFIRTGFFTCISGNVRFVLKINGQYKVVLSGEDYEYKSVIVPTGVAAVIQNIGSKEAMILNMPSPAWMPEMNDEHTADFSDFDFNSII